MPKSTTFSNEVLALFLNATAIANLAQNNATAPLTALFVSLHTADPGVGGSQTTNEISYTGYARQSVARTTSGFAAPSAGSSAFAANVDFPVSTGGTGGTVTHAAIGTLVSGTGKVLWTGPVSPTIAVSSGTIPRLTTATTVSES